MDKNLLANAEDTSLIPGPERKTLHTAEQLNQRAATTEAEVPQSPYFSTKESITVSTHTSTGVWPTISATRESLSSSEDPAHQN